MTGNVPAPPPRPKTRALRSAAVGVLGPTYSLFYDDPFHPVRGEGVWLFDADGESYLDCYNNVVSVGPLSPPCGGGLVDGRPHG